MDGKLIVFPIPVLEKLIFPVPVFFRYGKNELSRSDPDFTFPDTLFPFPISRPFVILFFKSSRNFQIVPRFLAVSWRRKDCHQIFTFKAYLIAGQEKTGNSRWEKRSFPIPDFSYSLFFPLRKKTAFFIPAFPSPDTLFPFPFPILKPDKVTSTIFFFPVRGP